MDLSLIELALVMVASVVGAIIQGSVGFGFGLVVIPVVSLLEPRALPASMLFLALPMTAWMAFRERASIETRGFVEITIGRLPGTLLGVVILGLVAADQLEVVIGAVIIGAVLLSFFAPEFELRTRWRLLAGMLSGFMGTVAAISGPPLALAYQRRPGPQLRATIAVSFVVGSIISLIALAIGGHVETSHVVLALKLLPGLIVGLILAARLHGFLDKRWLRPAVLVFAGIAGLAAIAKGLL